MPVQGNSREGGEHLQSTQLPRQASAQTRRTSFPGSRRETPQTQRPTGCIAMSPGSVQSLLRGCFHVWADPHEREPEHLPVWRGSPPSGFQLLPASWPAGKRAEPPPRSVRALAACPSACNLFKKAHFSLLPSSSNVTYSPFPVFFSLSSYLWDVS